MNMASRTSVLALLFFAVLGSPVMAQDGPIAKAVGKDLNCYHRWLAIVHKEIAEDTTGSWGKHCKNHHKWGLDAHKKAKDAYNSGKYLEAYKQLFEAKTRLAPCFDKIFTAKKLSEETKAIIRKETITLAERLGATKTFIDENVKEKNKSKMAMKTYNAAKADWEKAKKYDSSGKHGEAHKSVISAQRKLNKAIIRQLQFLKDKR